MASKLWITLSLDSKVLSLSFLIPKVSVKLSSSSSIIRQLEDEHIDETEIHF